MRYLHQFQVRHLLVLAVGALVVVSTAAGVQAEYIGFSASFDGSYDPYSSTPPPGQSTWLQKGVSVNPVVGYDYNTPAEGITSFLDVVSDSRFNVTQSNEIATDVGRFSTNQASDEYIYEIRMKIYTDQIAPNTSSAGAANLSFGFRDEYGGGTDYGKVVMLSWNYANRKYTSPYPATFGFGDFGTAVGPSNGIPVVVSQTKSDAYFDNQWHTYRVEKYIDNGDNLTKIKLFVDGVQIGSSILYSNLPDSTGKGEGVGLFGATVAKTIIAVDYFKIIPEPSSLVLLTGGLIGLLCYAWRKRR